MGRAHDYQVLLSSSTELILKDQDIPKDKDIHEQQLHYIGSAACW